MTYQLTACQSIAEIGKQAWDACANPVSTTGESCVPFDPFLSYAFLHALEESGSVTRRTGWAPYHLSLTDEEDVIQGVVPMYLKGHSQGEYIFDYSWADALERAGGTYYPKLLIAVPFTPATGRRILTRPGDEREIQGYLLSGCMQVAEQLEISSIHVNFAEKDQFDHMGELGFLQRTHKQFHWQNNDYLTFDDFLMDLSSKKRKNIRRERRDALQNSEIEIELLTGNDLKEVHWDHFYSFYVDTGNRKWGTPYLNRQFFSLIGESMPDDVLLIMAKRAGRYIAGAINFIGSECLFGRNWGCLEDHPFLHFEVCYYQAIDFAIQRRLARVEAGAQGPHKLARGYMPSHTYSAHWIVNKSFRDAIDHFLVQERQYVDEEIDYLADHSPFRQPQESEYQGNSD